MKFGKIELTDGMIERAKQAGSSEDLMKLAWEYNVSLTEEDVKGIQPFLNEGELSDDDLAAVAGGKGEAPTDPLYSAEQRVVLDIDGEVKYGTVTSVRYVKDEKSWYVTVRFDAGGIYECKESWVNPA